MSLRSRFTVSPAGRARLTSFVRKPSLVATMVWGPGLTKASYLPGAMNSGRPSIFTWAPGSSQVICTRASFASMTILCAFACSYFSLSSGSGPYFIAATRCCCTSMGWSRFKSARTRL